MNLEETYKHMGFEMPSAGGKWRYRVEFTIDVPDDWGPGETLIHVQDKWNSYRGDEWDSSSQIKTVHTKVWTSSEDNEE